MKQVLDLVKREKWKKVLIKNKELKMINTEKKKIRWIWYSKFDITIKWEYRKMLEHLISDAFYFL